MTGTLRHYFSARHAVSAVIMIMGLFLSLSLAAEAMGAPPPTGQTGAVGEVKPGQAPQIPVTTIKPDLTATITLTPKNPHQKNGVTCYSIQPVVVISNQGAGTQKSFEYTLEWSFSTTPNAWQVCSVGTVNGLGHGQSHTVVGPNTASLSLVWCPNDPGTPGYRVTVDTKKSVTEGNEDNVAERRYHPRPEIMKKVKKAF